METTIADRLLSMEIGIPLSQGKPIEWKQLLENFPALSKTNSPLAGETN